MEKLTKDEKDYIINILEKQLKKVKEYESIPDDYFTDFAVEVKIDQFLTNLIKKIKGL